MTTLQLTNNVSITMEGLTVKHIKFEGRTFDLSGLDLYNFMGNKIQKHLINIINETTDNYKNLTRKDIERFGKRLTFELSKTSKSCDNYKVSNIIRDYQKRFLHNLHIKMELDLNNIENDKIHCTYKDFSCTYDIDTKRFYTSIDDSCFDVDIKFLAILHNLQDIVEKLESTTFQELMLHESDVIQIYRSALKISNIIKSSKDSFMIIKDNNNNKIQYRVKMRELKKDMELFNTFVVYSLLGIDTKILITWDKFRILKSEDIINYCCYNNVNYTKLNKYLVN